VRTKKKKGERIVYDRCDIIGVSRMIFVCKVGTMSNVGVKIVKELHNYAEKTDNG